MVGPTTDSSGDGQGAEDPMRPPARRRPFSWHWFPIPVRWLLLGISLLLLWYAAIGGWKAGIHYDTALRPSAEQLPAGGSVTLGLAARLIEQQTQERAFTPNDPFFYPTAFARRTKAFQSSVIVSLHDVLAAVARIGGSNTIAEAAAELSVPSTQWWLNGSWPLLGRTAEWHYQKASEAIVAANHDLAARRAGAGSFVANLRDRDTVLRTILESIDQQAERGDQLIRNPRSGDLRTQIAHARGTAYVATILLRGLAEDNVAVIRGSGRAARWSEARDALDEVVRIDPWVSGQSDLVRAGYSLLIAGNAIRSILEG